LSARFAEGRAAYGAWDKSTSLTGIQVTMESKSHSLLERESPPANIATQLGEPSLTLIENGPALGVLISESCHQDSFRDALYLDHVTWARGDESARTLRDFPEVCLGRSDQNFWIAEDPATGRLFPQPNLRSFPMLFVSERDYRNLMQWRYAGDARSIFTFVRYRFSQLHGFHLHRERLVAPPSFASVAGVSGRDFVSEY
jgi:hypothetical protein